VSEAMATTAAGGSQDGASPAQGPRGAWLTPVNVVIVASTVLALGLRLYYQYTRPGFLLGVNEYDDGPYFGSAVRLLHGVLPYRSFVLVQPPGITLLMSPAAGLSYFTGTAWGLAIGRVLTMLAGAAAAGLGGLLVRHRGLVPVIVTCGVLAIYPDSVAAAHTVLVEPWLVLFCLIGALAVFDRDHLASRRRVIWGGVAFGFAGAVEGWAIVPVAVLFLLICLTDLRRAARFAAGVAAGFVVPVLPFAALAPRQFYQSLITAQVGYRAHAFRIPLYYRLENIAGLLSTHRWTHLEILLAVAVIIALVAGGQFIAWLVTGRAAPLLDWFAMVTAVLVVFMFLWPPQFHYHFAAFLAPFLALSVGLALGRLLDAAQPRASAAGAGRWLMPAAAGLATVVIAVMAVFQAKSENVVPRVIGPIPAATERLIPPGACVLSDQVVVTIAADRFVSNVPGCPRMVDTLGTDLALSHGLKPGTGAGRVPAVASLWLSAFQHAQYILLTNINDRRVPWTPALTSYLQQHFVEVPQPAVRLTLYARRGLRP
jgi:hypothetical protein